MLYLPRLGILAANRSIWRVMVISSTIPLYHMSLEMVEKHVVNIMYKAMLCEKCGSCGGVAYMYIYINMYIYPVYPTWP